MKRSSLNHALVLRLWHAGRRKVGIEELWAISVERWQGVLRRFGTFGLGFKVLGFRIVGVAV